MRTTTRLQRNAQAGFGHLGPIIALVVVLTVVGIIGYKLYGSKTTDKAVSSAPTAVSKELTASNAPAVSKASDLDKADAVLSQVDTANQSTADANQLNSQLNGL